MQSAGGFDSLVISDQGAALTGFVGTAMGFTTDPTFTATGGAAANGISYTEGTGQDLSSTKLDNPTDAQTALTAINTRFPM